VGGGNSTRRTSPREFRTKTIRKKPFCLQGELEDGEGKSEKIDLLARAHGTSLVLPGWGGKKRKYYTFGKYYSVTKANQGGMRNPEMKAPQNKMYRKKLREKKLLGNNRQTPRSLGRDLLGGKGGKWNGVV